MGLPSSQKSYILLLLLSFLNVSTIYSRKQSKEDVLFGGNFPAIYVIGDSLVDPGNNNHLPTLIKANYPPYGSDFEGGIATGRFSNGKTIADYIAIYYKLPLVPAILGLSDSRKDIISTGFNYASAGCGILHFTGKIAGRCLSLRTQVDMFDETIENNLKTNFKAPFALREHLEQSLFLIVIGVNDYANFYTRLTDANDFADKLLHKFLEQIEKLHELGARKFFVNNIKPLGCYPNMIAKTFMLGLRGPSKNQVSSNLLNTTGPCCPLDYDGSLTSSCKRSSVSCKAPDTTHIFFDPRHPTQLANLMYSIACFDERTICHVV
ncbi:PREDICTED: LOW QUALITY PROTEIN: GDSL esterase/lipase At2g04020-like [Camelina sativa]|uniref:LOW QUALITY PROTEIN: GDSL esterase/lipase At2g04020-like n=1 Tax=Camelina sativa TaxID=90675 RepID=A0ABM1QGD1_CAMSA|nr:PREDICTED: LOW QUALITY PROTEIN: GDSL esterase/lipase At2g04020-like [Camelina sativa]